MSHRFLRRLKAESLKTVPGIQQYRVPHFQCSIPYRGISLELTGRARLRNGSGNIPEHKQGNQEPNEDRSQDDPHPEVGISVYQSRHSNDSGPDEAPQRKKYKMKQFLSKVTLCHLFG